jgi:beta-glucanase (GH16 family)
MRRTLKMAMLGLLSLGLTLGFMGCEDKPVDPVVLPTNFTWTLDYSATTKGKVTFTMNATNANYFSAIFKDKSGDVTVESPNGVVSHTFAAEGTYEVILKAHASAANYVKAMDTVEITGVTLNDGYSTPTSYGGYNLAWADEFSGDALDLSSWGFDVGNGSGGWGNNESQYYTSGTANCVVANGKLTITAKKESQGGYNYTSARILTKGKREFQYGRIDIRARLPKGQGIWPALWMLGSNFSSVGWPNCGELDIMELVGHQPNRVHGTAHFGNQPPSTQRTASYGLSSGTFSDAYHVFTLKWENNLVEWYVDDVKFHTLTPGNTGGIYPFNQKFFFIFNIAVGGNWPGYPDATTVFPQQMDVDYVRVFQKI